MAEVKHEVKLCCFIAIVKMMVKAEPLHRWACVSKVSGSKSHTDLETLKEDYGLQTLFVFVATSR